LAVFALLLTFAYPSGYWMVAAPFLPLTPWMIVKVRAQQQSKVKND
jgi:hypothetical protein